MDKLKRPDHNFTYYGPTDEIGDLPCRISDENVVFSHWRPDEEELAILNAGGCIELGIWSRPIPPVRLKAVPALEGEANAPFKAPKPPPRGGNGRPDA